MKCRNCGTDLNKDALFCHRCGKRVPIDEYLDKYNEEDELEENPPKKGHKAVVVLLVILILLVLLGLAAVASFMFMGTQSSTILEAYSRPTATEPVSTDRPSVVATIVPKDATTTDKPEKNTSKNRDDEAQGHIAEPEYRTYTDSEYRFSCSYPTHFEKYIDNSHATRYALRINDGEVTMRICAEDNENGITLQQSLSMFKSKHSGEVEYSNVGQGYYAVRINEDGVCYYKYLRSKNKNFYWFEFSYPEEERDVYEEYIEHIYGSFTVK